MKFFYDSDLHGIIVSWGKYIEIIFVAGNATYKSPCRSVGPSVGPSICPSVRPFRSLYFFCVFEQFEGRKVRV